MGFGVKDWDSSYYINPKDYGNTLDKVMMQDGTWDLSDLHTDVPVSLREELDQS